MRWSGVLIPAQGLRTGLVLWSEGGSFLGSKVGPTALGPAAALRCGNCILVLKDHRLALLGESPAIPRARDVRPTAFLLIVRAGRLDWCLLILIQAVRLAR